MTPPARVPIPGTPWCKVRAADGRVFFYDTASKTSAWELPDDLKGVDLPPLPGEEGDLVASSHADASLDASKRPEGTGETEAAGGAASASTSIPAAIVEDSGDGTAEDGAELAAKRMKLTVSPDGVPPTGGVALAGQPMVQQGAAVVHAMAPAAHHLAGFVNPPGFGGQIPGPVAGVTHPPHQPPPNYAGGGRGMSAQQAMNHLPFDERAEQVDWPGVVCGLPTGPALLEPRLSSAARNTRISTDHPLV